MADTFQEPDLNLIFKAARRAHERGNFEDALGLYKTISDKNPYYPGLDIQMRALEMQMTRGPVPERPRSKPSRQPPVVSTRSSGPTRPARHSPRGNNPYLLYGTITFGPAIVLTLILSLIVGSNLDMLITWLGVINVIAFFIYGYDKLIAPSGLVRVPELILVAQVLLGAFVGGPLARVLFRHKTQKLSFRVKFWIAEIVCITWIVLYLILTQDRL